MRTSKEYYAFLAMKGPLPPDCNELAIEHAKQYNDDDLLSLIAYNSKKRFYGETVHIGSDGMPVCTYYFTKGICSKAVAFVYVNKNINKGTIVFYDTKNLTKENSK